MVQRIKKEHQEEKIKKKNLYISLAILIIMLSSIIGFAMMSGDGTVGTNSNGIPKEIEFQQFNQEGQIFWGAIKNYEQFIFENIDGFDTKEDLKKLAAEIKTKKEIKIYVDENYESSDSIFMVDKVLRGLEIRSTKITTNTCDETTLVLTNNQSFAGNCMKLISEKGEEYKNTNILVYHLIQ